MVWAPLPAWGPPYRPHILSLLPCPPTPASRSRFDAGSGMATIRHPTPLALGQFHTVTLLRSLTQGSLIVGSLAPVNGTSQVRPSPVPPGPAPPLTPPSLAATPDVPSAQGKFQGLDLNEELYLGGYPDYGAIPKAGLSSGFVGEPPDPRLQPRAGRARGHPGGWASRHPHLGSSCPPTAPRLCPRAAHPRRGDRLPRPQPHGPWHLPLSHLSGPALPGDTPQAAQSSRLPPATALGRDRHPPTLQEVGEGPGVLGLTFGGCLAERGPVPGLGEQQLCVCVPGWLHREPL